MTTPSSSQRTTELEILEASSTPSEDVSVSRVGLVLRKFLKKKLALVGVAVLVLLAFAAYVGPDFSKWKFSDTDPDPFQSLVGPNRHHWFGTDLIGHDLFVQTMTGLQKSLLIGLIAAVLSTATAAVVGSLSGYFGKWTDRGLSWIVDMLLVLPSFLVLAVISPKLRGHSFLLLAVLLAAFNWMITAKVVRGLTFSLKEREFVTAARFMGVRPWTIITRHILPNMASLLIVDVTINVSGTIIAETGLSYFGFGVQAPDVSLGTLIQQGTSNPGLSDAWLWIFPGLMLILTVLSVNLIGDGLRDAIDATSTAASEG